MSGEAYIHVRLAGLAVAAGCVDAACFLGLDQIFTANQTGNTVLLGIAIGRGDGDAVARAGLAVVAFVAGVLLGGAALRGAPRGWSRRLALVLVGEALLLALLAVLWRPAGTLPAIAVAAVAMGAQSAATLQAGIPGVTTTFVTGAITRTFTRLAQRGHGPPLEPLPAAVWLAYLAGATAGGVVTRWSDAWAVAIAAALVAAAAIAPPHPRPR
jgi:uncharacterized membrane protein YoaK (UPF0700 family)